MVPGGTGLSAQIKGVQVAGKTGTAQNPHGPDHAWFVGFAPFENPKIAIAVLVENAGFGGTAAAPIAGKCMQYYLVSANFLKPAPPAQQMITKASSVSHPNTGPSPQHSGG
jgi:penicillin-binding protein 2